MIQAAAETLKTVPVLVNTVIADCWTKLGNDEQAFFFYNRALELQPGSFQGAVGKCRLHLLRGEFEAAREICRTHVRDQNDLGELTQVAAQVEFFSASFERAKELYLKLLKSDVKGGGSFYGAVTYQSALGRIDQALGADDEAIQFLEASFAAETALAGVSADESSIAAATAHADEGSDPPGDLGGQPDYRRHLARVLTRRAVLAAASN